MEIAKTGTMEDYMGDIDEIIKYLQGIYEFDFRNDLNFPVPVYFITGEEDTACPHSLLKDIVDDINAPKKKLFIMEKAGHCCFYDRKQEFYKLLLDVSDEN